MHAQSDPNFPVQVNIESGMIEGNYDNRTGLQTYLGVPFAQAPIGDLRWKAPQALNSWTGVRNNQAVWSKTCSSGGFW